MSAWAIVWDRNKAIDIGEWSICGGGQLERFDCIWLLLDFSVLATSKVICTDVYIQ